MKPPAWVNSSLIPLSFLLFLLWISGLASQELLPDPVAIHWGLNLKADGFASIQAYQLFTVGFLGFFAVCAISARFILRKLPILNHLIGLVFAGVYWLVLAIVVIATGIQISETDARNTTFPLGMILAILLVIPISLWVFLDFPRISLGDKLAVRLRGIKMIEIDYSQIQSVRLAQISPWKYGGLGVRVLGKKIAFIPSKGEALVLGLKSGEEVAIRVKSGEDSLTAISSKTNG